MIKITIICSLLLLTIKSKLLFVNELFRHGARGTIVDETWNSDIEEYMKEELTPTGMRQHFVLGQTLRKQYIEEQQFLSTSLDYDEIYIRCTDFNRTLQSGLSQLYGLYPPHTGDSMNNKVSEEDKLPPFKGAKQPSNGMNAYQALPNLAQPVPIHVEEDIITYPPNYCPNYLNIREKYATDDLKPVYDQINANYSETFTTFEKLIDYDRHGEQHGKVYDGELNFGNIEDVWDVLVADLNNGLPLPAGMTDQLWANLTELDTLNWFVIEAGCPEAIQLQNTDIFKSWMDNFDRKIEEKDKMSLKWAMYSGHDSNVASAMVGLGLADWQCNVELFQTGETSALNCNQRPYFAASIILELHENNGVNQVAVKYDGEYQYLCGKKQKFCDYETFKKDVLQAQILDAKQQEELCTIPQSIYTQIQQNINVSGVIITIVMVCLIVFSLFSVLVQAAKYQRNKINLNKSIGNRKNNNNKTYNKIIENTV